MSKSTYAMTKAWRARNRDTWHAYRRDYYLRNKAKEYARNRRNLLRRRSLLAIPSVWGGIVMLPLPRVEEMPEWHKEGRMEQRNKPTETAFSCNDDSSYKNGKSNGEQLFTLRAQDITTPECIAYWILKNIETAPEEKLRHALDDALRARKWPRRKRAD